MNRGFKPGCPVHVLRSGPPPGPRSEGMWYPPARRTDEEHDHHEHRVDRWRNVGRVAEGNNDFLSRSGNPARFVSMAISDSVENLRELLAAVGGAQALGKPVRIGGRGARPKGKALFIAAAMNTLMPPWADAYSEAQRRQLREQHLERLASPASDDRAPGPVRTNGDIMREVGERTGRQLSSSEIGLLFVFGNTPHEGAAAMKLVPASETVTVVLAEEGIIDVPGDREAFETARKTVEASFRRWLSGWERAPESEMLNLRAWLVTAYRAACRPP